MFRTFVFPACTAQALTTPHAYAGAYSDPPAAQLYNDRGDREAILHDLNGYINNKGAKEDDRYPSRYPNDAQDDR